MVLDFFEDAEETDDEVNTVHDQSNADKDDKNDLIVTYSIADTTFMAA